MSFEQLDEMEAREIVPGFHGKLIHSEGMTVAFWEVDAGAELPEHAHMHEQVTALLEGMFELTVAGEVRIMEPGGVAVIPGHVVHSGRALTRCRIVDAFHPPRDDYR